MAASLSFLVEHATAGLIVVAYLVYEIHWGRLSTLAAKIDEVIVAVIALARATPRVNEQKVVDRLDGHTPDDLLVEPSREPLGPEQKPEKERWGSD
jgi:hypothetical protein